MYDLNNIVKLAANYQARNMNFVQFGKRDHNGHLNYPNQRSQSRPDDGGYDESRYDEERSPVRPVTTPPAQSQAPLPVASPPMQAPPPIKFSHAPAPSPVASSQSWGAPPPMQFSHET